MTRDGAADPRGHHGGQEAGQPVDPVAGQTDTEGPSRPGMASRSSSRTNHLSLFPFSPQVVAAVKGRLAGYDLSKGTIRFTEAKPIPEDVIWEILDLRLEEIG
jgi:hypothetical protein